MIKIFNCEEFLRERAANENQLPDVSQTVAEILADVKARGDKAIIDYEQKFDRITLKKLALTQDEIDQACGKVSYDYVETLARAAKNIREFHSNQVRSGFMFSNREGAILGQRVMPLERVGIYVPGGSAAYPSTVLMNAIPAKIAGCNEIFMATPPEIKPEIIAAALIAGVDKIFAMGGAQAVAGFAYGTESIAKVDKIVGPGNIYVAEAKRQVFGRVAIDMIAGPSEILIIADKNNYPKHLAADMLAQAEHDKFAKAMLITNSIRLAKNVSAEIESQLANLERYEIARASIDNNGRIILVNNWSQACDIANEIAPEHLEICVDEPFEWLSTGKIKHAGSIFIGRYSPEALGDYYAGPNHTLPTMGTARFSSPLSVDDFVKKSQYIYYSYKALNEAANDIERLALSEGLTGHAQSIKIRKEW